VRDRSGAETWAPEPLDEGGLTLVELLIVIVVLGILFVIAVGAVRRARASANESSALSSIRLIGQAETNFSAVCGRGGYAASLRILGQAPPAASAGFLDGSLASDPAERSGFEFRVQRPADAITIGQDCHGQVTASRYYVSARPFDFGSTGNFSYASNESGQIWETTTPMPPVEPFGPPARLIK
jgi:type IV pilus assembly protein PilA